MIFQFFCVSVSPLASQYQIEKTHVLESTRQCRMTIYPQTACYKRLLSPWYFPMDDILVWPFLQFPLRASEALPLLLAFSLHRK